MDIQQLKLLAGRVRGLLEQSGHPIGHSQSLDLISALPGLRNWPEVQAFPDRVSACDLDLASVGRLSFRLKRSCEIELSPQETLAALSPPGTPRPSRAPQIWPTGPAPGVYITTSQEAIYSLLLDYEEATDGALVYAERAGSHWESSIDLGEGGLWSSGLYRVPSGTLVVVGPVELNQQFWDSSSNHLEMACLLAKESDLRVAVLIETPRPKDMFEDVQLMVQSLQEEDEGCDAALSGIVAENGKLLPRQPFSRPRQALTHTNTTATTAAIPVPVRNQLERALDNRTSGLLLFGSSNSGDHSAIDLVAASLAMTEHAGPVARIMPRSRSTPAKDWDVPAPIADLPFLPSIESAYEQGYRRMLFTPGYTRSELLAEFSRDVLLISGSYGSDVGEVFMSTLRSGSHSKESDLLSQVIAILGVTDVPTEEGVVQVNDLFLPSQAIALIPEDFDAMLDFLRSNRTVRWEDQMNELLKEGRISPTGIREVFARNRVLNAFLARWEAGRARLEPAN